MQWMMLQQQVPDDFVIATGKQYSVRDFVKWSANHLGITLKFDGNGAEETATVLSVIGNRAPGVKTGDVILRIDKRYYRPTEVESLLGDPSKAKNRLGWEPEVSAKQMCEEMIESDLKIAKQHSLLAQHGFNVSVSNE
jgi:GDPmannose 4,6-dehydratase